MLHQRDLFDLQGKFRHPTLLSSTHTHTHRLDAGTLKCGLNLSASTIALPRRCCVSYHVRFGKSPLSLELSAKTFIFRRNTNMGSKTTQKRCCKLLIQTLCISWQFIFWSTYSFVAPAPVELLADDSIVMEMLAGFETQSYCSRRQHAGPNKKKCGSDSRDTFRGRLNHCLYRRGTLPHLEVQELASQGSKP